MVKEVEDIGVNSVARHDVRYRFWRQGLTVIQDMRVKCGSARVNVVRDME